MYNTESHLIIASSAGKVIKKRDELLIERDITLFGKVALFSERHPAYIELYYGTHLRHSCKMRSEAIASLSILRYSDMIQADLILIWPGSNT